MVPGITFGLILQSADNETAIRIGSLVLVLACILIYFIPSIVGSRKKNSGAIIALNLLLGWTLIGWVVALVWALTYEEKRWPQPQTSQPVAPVLCVSCGKYAAANATFCQSCGTALKAV